MKRLFSATFAAALAASASAARVATEGWVAAYVASNAAPKVATEIDPTVLTAYDDDGSASTVTLRWSLATNAAWRVKAASSASRIAVGSTFAKVGARSWYGVQDAYCTTLTSSVERVWAVLTGAVDVVTLGVTNRVYSGTNYVCATVYRADVDGVAYSAVQVEPGRLSFVPDAAVDATRWFDMEYVLLSDAQKRSVIGATSAGVRRRSWLLELLAPSAYAVSPGEWWGPTQTYEDPPAPRDPGMVYDVYGRYCRRWYTDEKDAKAITLDAIEWDNSAGHAVYTVDHVFYEIKAGVEITDEIGLLASAIGDFTLDNVKAALQSTLERGRYIQLTRGAAYESLKANVTKMAGEVNAFAQEVVNKYSALLAAGGYPETDDRLLGTGVEECKNHVWRGKCGAWYCTRCFMSGSSVAALPKEHSYAGCTGCDVCRNAASSNPYARCEYRPPEIEHHHGWARDEAPADLARRCVCSCGKYTLAHSEPTGSHECEYHRTSDGQCARLWKCSRCGEMDVYKYYVIGTGPHVITYTAGDTATVCGHLGVTDGKFTQTTSGGKPACSVTYTCTHADDEYPGEGCGMQQTTILTHDIDWDLQHVTEIEGDDECHAAAAPCANGFRDAGEPWASNVANSNWCGFVTNVTDINHRYSDYAVGEVGNAVCPPTATTHTRYKVCGDWETGDFNPTNGAQSTCGHVYAVAEAHTEHSSGNGYRKLTDALHTVSNTCSECGYVRFLRNESHRRSAAAGEVFAYLNQTFHVVSNYCGDCLAWYWVNAEPHTNRDCAAVAYPVEGDHRRHAWTNWCEACESAFDWGTEPHLESVFWFTKLDDPDRHEKWTTCPEAGGGCGMAWRMYTTNCATYCSALSTNAANYGKDATHHWLACECGRICARAEHDQATVRTNATAGVVTYDCSVCGYCVRSENLEAEQKASGTKLVFLGTFYAGSPPYPDGVRAGWQPVAFSESGVDYLCDRYENGTYWWFERGLFNGGGN